MHCDQFLVALDDYLDDRLDADVRREFRRHLAECRRCRDAAMAVDPTMLFVAAPRPEPDELQVEACVAGVEALIRQQRLERQLRPRHRSFMAAAAAVVLLLGAGAVWRFAGPEETAQSAAETGVAVASDVAVEDEPPRVEVNMGDDAVRVYQFAQEEDADTAVYFIVNASLES